MLLSRELKKDVPARGMLYYLCCCCMRYPDALVTVHMDSASGLEKQDFVGEGMYHVYSSTTGILTGRKFSEFDESAKFHQMFPSSASVLS